MKQSTAKPTRKVTVAFIGSILVALASAVITAAASVHIPSAVVVAATIIGAVVPAYIAEEKG